MNRKIRRAIVRNAGENWRELKDKAAKQRAAEKKAAKDAAKAAQKEGA